jgi:hypothetical protein
MPPVAPKEGSSQQEKPKTPAEQAKDLLKGLPFGKWSQYRIRQVPAACTGGVNLAQPFRSKSVKGLHTKKSGKKVSTIW